MDYNAPSRLVLCVEMPIKMEMKQLLVSDLGLEVEAALQMGELAISNIQRVH